MNDFKEVWYVWDGKGDTPKSVLKAACQCGVVIDDSKYLNSGCGESLDDWYGDGSFIKAYTKGENRRQIRCSICGGSKYRASLFSLLKCEPCEECKGTGKVWEYEK